MRWNPCSPGSFASPDGCTSRRPAAYRLANTAGRVLDSKGLSLCSLAGTDAQKKEGIVKEKVRRKLELSKEVVRELQTKELEGAYGGAPTCTATGSCTRIEC